MSMFSSDLKPIWFRSVYREDFTTIKELLNIEPSLVNAYDTYGKDIISYMEKKNEMDLNTNNGQEISRKSSPHAIAHRTPCSGIRDSESARPYGEKDGKEHSNVMRRFFLYLFRGTSVGMDANKPAVESSKDQIIGHIGQINIKPQSIQQTILEYIHAFKSPVGDVRPEANAQKKDVPYCDTNRVYLNDEMARSLLSLSLRLSDGQILRAVVICYPKIVNVPQKRKKTILMCILNYDTGYGYYYDNGYNCYSSRNGLVKLILKTPCLDLDLKDKDGNDSYFYLAQMFDTKVLEKYDDMYTIIKTIIEYNRKENLSIYHIYKLIRKNRVFPILFAYQRIMKAECAPAEGMRTSSDVLIES